MDLPGERAAWIALGRTRYEDVWSLQKSVVRSRRRGSLSRDVILVTEHEPVLTLGRATQPANVLVRDVPIVAVERGGDVTYHGPGQLVIYPCVQLVGERRDLHAWLRTLEEVVIETLRAFALDGCREEGKTGVWVGPHKVASIGIAVSHWVSYHGIGLNVETPAEAFHRIRPCGFEADVMRSMQDLLSRPIGMSEVERVCRTVFANVLGIGIDTLDPAWLTMRLADVDA
ncbi:MAG: lipoyl(octanoyl) transferase LipB [Planctomycetes bacterium]|nr:lipoyl(octanoyl) transferase LipB [Planctomycetota bacterium]